HSIGPDLSCSAVDTSCCRCFRPPWSRAVGSAMMRFLRAMAPPRLCPDRSSPSLPISARLWDHLPTAGRARCLVAIFLPPFLLVIGVLPFWEDLRRRSGARATLGGINAAVVGLLIAAFYDPVWTRSEEHT